MFSDNETIDYFEIMALVDSFVEANSASIAINEDKLFSMALKKTYYWYIWPYDGVNYKV